VFRLSRRMTWRETPATPTTVTDAPSSRIRVMWSQSDNRYSHGSRDTAVLAGWKEWKAGCLRRGAADAWCPRL
jgi:hypothetical protein